MSGRNCWIAIVLLAVAAHQGRLGAQQISSQDPNAERLINKQAPATVGFQYSDPTTYRFRVTIRVEAPFGPIRNVIATGPVPIDWPEQKIKLLTESKPKGSRTKLHSLRGRAAILTFQVPFIPKGGSAAVERLYEVTRFRTKLLVAHEQLRVPEQVPRQMREFLAAAPGVEIRNRQIVNLAMSLHDPEDTAWTTVRSFHDWVRSNVHYQSGNYTGAKAALQRKVGDCEDMTALFVALCRATKIPARSVWIEGHAYPEFYLVDSETNGFWIPAELTGPAWFGESQEYRTILQKGDRIMDPIRRRYSHYVPQTARATGGVARLSIRRTRIQDSAQSPLGQPG